jgi:hypothetical protein
MHDQHTCQCWAKLNTRYDRLLYKMQCHDRPLVHLRVPSTWVTQSSCRPASRSQNTPTSTTLSRVQKQKGGQVMGSHLALGLASCSSKVGRKRLLQMPSSHHQVAICGRTSVGRTSVGRTSAITVTSRNRRRWCGCNGSTPVARRLAHLTTIVLLSLCARLSHVTISGSGMIAATSAESELLASVSRTHVHAPVV